MVFFGLALAVVGCYIRANLGGLEYARQLGDITAIIGLGVFAYACVLLSMASRSAYR